MMTQDQLNKKRHRKSLRRKRLKFGRKRCHGTMDNCSFHTKEQSKGWMRVGA